ncbi:MAG: efflux RND transporter periplasmic adaptor subunit [Pseudomonadota bacterium]
MAGFFLLAALAWTSGTFHDDTLTEAPQTPITPTISVIDRSPGAHSGTITAFGEMRSRFEVQLSSQVSGRVVRTSANAERGMRLSTGDVLLKIEDVSYRMAVAEAQQGVADAKLQWKQESRQADRAREEWDNANFAGEPSDLALRVPQLELARQAILAAEARLRNAQNNLQLTELSAPFDAIVVERSAAVGDVLTVGTPTFKIASVDRVEARIPLAASQWRELDLQQLQHIALRSPETGHTWTGYLLRTDQHVDAQDRQRGLVVAVDHPLERQPPLYPGTFVAADIPTRTYTDAYRLPASALSAEGHVWWVNESLLARARPDTVAHLNDEILLVVDDFSGPIQFVVRPLANFNMGDRVRTAPLDRPAGLLQP